MKPGDIIGVSYDLSGVRAVLKFMLNGKDVPEWKKQNVHGDVYPAFSVTRGAEVEVNFGGNGKVFKYCPRGFEGVIFSMDLI